MSSSNPNPIEDAAFEELFEAIWADVADDLTPPGEILSNETAFLEDDLTLDELREDIREGLREALSGEGFPIDQLWEQLDDK